MALKLYLDDCAFAHHLVELLRKAGHTVVTPVEANIRGEKDDIHLRYAVTNGLILITKNPGDFLALHESDSHHPGIVAIYQDNDPDRDMNYQEIVAALARLEEASTQSGLAIAADFHILNHWRF